MFVSSESDLLSDSFNTISSFKVIQIRVDLENSPTLLLQLKTLEYNTGKSPLFCLVHA